VFLVVFQTSSTPFLPKRTGEEKKRALVTVDSTKAKILHSQLGGGGKRTALDDVLAVEGLQQLASEVGTSNGHGESRRTYSSSLLRTRGIVTGSSLGGHNLVSSKHDAVGQFGDVISSHGDFLSFGFGLQDNC